MKILWKKTEIITTFAGVLERKSVHLVVPHFWEGPQLGKILVFFFSPNGGSMKMPEM